MAGVVVEAEDVDVLQRPSLLDLQTPAGLTLMSPWSRTAYLQNLQRSQCQPVTLPPPWPKLRSPLRSSAGGQRNPE